MIVLRTPKGWTGPKLVDGVPVEGTFRAHQVPLADFATKPEHMKMLEDWMKSYRPEELFDENGHAASANWPNWRRRASGAWAPIRTPTAACCCATCVMPDFRDYAVEFPSPGIGRSRSHARDGRVPARRDEAERRAQNFRVVGPDETASNRLGRLFEVTNRVLHGGDPAHRRPPVAATAA